MATQALYNRWRGQTFADILGQEHITITLRNQIKAGRIGHAYLFTGLRGTGKTSTARIMAKAVNCIGDTDDPPCNVCPVCRSITEGRSLDLVEIDGASNRGIDEIRELRDRVAFAPSESRFKVYVIDEVHMLTNEAFNALLKTLEEPPAHVIFVLCTTEPARLPETVLSRCQRFDFRRGSLATLMSKLRHICEREGIAIAPAALEFIARRATGSFRDAESLLDQLAAYGAQEITLTQVQDVLGSVSWELVGDLAESLVARDVPTGLRLISEALDAGAEPRQFLGEVLDFLRGVMLLQAGAGGELLNVGPEAQERMEGLLAKYSPSPGVLVRALRLFNDAGQGLRTAVRPQLPLELAFVEATITPEAAGPASRREEGAPPRRARSARGETDPTAGAAMPRPAERQAAPTEPMTGDSTRARRPVANVAPVGAPLGTPSGAPTGAATGGSGAEGTVEAPGASTPEAAAPETSPEAAPPDEPGVEAPEGGLSLEWVRGYWPQVLTKVRAANPMLQALLNSTQPVHVEGNLVTLNCEAPFHRDKLSEESKREVVEQVISLVLGRECRVTFVVGSPTPRASGEAVPRREAGTAGDLFSVEPDRPSARDELLNHPAVKELQRRGGRISNVSVFGEDSGEEHEERG